MRKRNLLFSRLGIRRNGCAFSLGVHDPSVLHLWTEKELLLAVAVMVVDGVGAASVVQGVEQMYERNVAATNSSDRVAKACTTRAEQWQIDHIQCQETMAPEKRSPKKTER